jgi:hypothetical protein
MDEIEKQEILNSYKWIKVPKYTDDEGLPFEERFKRLQEHHLKETTFLIDKIREIIKKI